MKVLILAGGLGSRLSEKTHKIPKPMILIGSKPPRHIMKFYQSFNVNQFIILGGYKSNLIKKYFYDERRKGWFLFQ